MCGAKRRVGDSSPAAGEFGEDAAVSAERATAQYPFVHELDRDEVRSARGPSTRVPVCGFGAVHGHRVPPSRVSSRPTMEGRAVDLPQCQEPAGKSAHQTGLVLRLAIFQPPKPIRNLYAGPSCHSHAQLRAVRPQRPS